MHTKTVYHGWLSLALLAVLFLFVVLPLPAQNNPQTMRLSLQEALDLVEVANYEVRMAETDIDKYRSQYRQTNAAFLPSLSLEGRVVKTNDPLNSFGFKLKQESVTASDFNPDILNDPEGIQNFTTSLQLQQPLVNPDMWYRRGAARSMVDAAREELEGTIAHARYRLKQAYYGLLLSGERLDVLKASLEAARENERQSANFRDQGIISKADYLRARVRRLELESQLSRARDGWEDTMGSLKYLLDLDKEVELQLTDSLTLAQAASPVALDGEAAMNSGLQAQRHRVEAARKQLQSSRFSFLPTLNLFGTYEFNDDVIFGTQGDSYLVGATLRWDLFNGYSKAAKVMESKADLKKAELAYQSRLFRNELEIEEAQRAVEQALRQLELTESMIEQAEEDYRIRRNRYEQGMEQTSDLLTAEAALARARLARLDALYQYHIGRATLELLIESR